MNKKEKIMDRLQDLSVKLLCLATDHWHAPVDRSQEEELEYYLGYLESHAKQLQSIFFNSGPDIQDAKDIVFDIDDSRLNTGIADVDNVPVQVAKIKKEINQLLASYK